MNMRTAELLAYCERHGYKLLEQYTTDGDESHPNVRARVLTPDNETHYLYYDPTRKRRTPRQQTLALEAYNNGDLAPLESEPRQRGWRNVTLDNRQRVARRNRQAEEANSYVPPECNGLCQPELCLYEGKCPLHGIGAFLEGLSSV